MLASSSAPCVHHCLRNFLHNAIIAREQLTSAIIFVRVSDVCSSAEHDRLESPWQWLVCQKDTTLSESCSYLIRGSTHPVPRLTRMRKNGILDGRHVEHVYDVASMPGPMHQVMTPSAALVVLISCRICQGHVKVSDSLAFLNPCHAQCFSVHHSN